MAQNLELKIKIASADGIIPILEKIGAGDEGILNQKDTYYKFDKGLLKLRNVNGKFELIKYLRDESGERRWSNYELLNMEGKDVEKYLTELFEVEVIVEKIRKIFISQKNFHH